MMILYQFFKTIAIFQVLLYNYCNRFAVIREREKVHYIIVNETRLQGKSAKKLETVKAVFDTAGIKYEILTTKREGDAKSYAHEITSSGGKHVLVAMGGDGTLHDLINGFADFDNFSMGLIPLGTGNDFAGAAKIPLDVKKAAEIIAFHAPRPIDFIELSSGLRSINAVGMGIDVDVLKRTYAGTHTKKTKYLYALIASLVHFKSYDFTIKYDGKEEKHRGLIAALGNGIQFGGGIKICPDAKLDDGLMDMIIVDYITKPKILPAFIKLMRGKINDIKGVTVVKTTAASFETKSENYTIQAEGELYDNMPLDAHIVAGKLKFYLP